LGEDHLSIPNGAIRNGSGAQTIPIVQTDTGKVKIGQRYQRRFDGWKAIFGPYKQPGRMVRIKIALENMRLILRGYYHMVRDLPLRYILIAIVYVFFMVCGVIYLMAVTEDIRRAESMQLLMQNKESFIDPCTVIGAPDKSINGYGDQTCKDKKGIPTYTAINHEWKK
jgi:hypothetical protein